jgi:hypothetical protein
MDISLSECDMVRCEHGHIYHNECVSKFNFKGPPELTFKDEDEDEDDYGSDTKSEFCPVCQLVCLTDEDELKFLRHMYKTTKEGSLKNIKENFGSLKNFHDSV